MSPAVLHIDNHLLVVDKPAGLLSQADRTGDPDVLTWGKEFLRERFEKPGAVYLGLVHRLDRPVSGVLVLARTSKAAARLSRQVRRRTVAKEYLAVVEGRPSGQGTWIDHVRKVDGRSESVDEDAEGAREAILHWEPVRSDGPMTLVAIRLETGRAHQIRVQFARRGHPIVGDFRYGSRMPLDGRNLALHCARMTIHHPTLGRRMAFEAPMPGMWPAGFRCASREGGIQDG